MCIPQATCAAEKAEALERAAKELETVKRQLTNAIQDKNDAATRAQQANSQLQVSSRERERRRARNRPTASCM